MSVSIGELVGTISLNDQMSGKLNEAAQGLGIFSTSFGAVTGALGGGAALIGGVTAAIVALGSHGADVNDIQEAFGTLSERMGSTADVMLGELQRGTLGTISNFDLMTMANKALGSGMIRSSEDMGTLAAGAKVLADRTGVDTAQAFDTLTTAMASGRTAALKQIGIFVDSKVAIEQYREKMGGLTGELTDSQRATALSQAALAALRREVSSGGKQFPDFADNVARAKVAVANWTDSLAVAIAKSPILSAGMGILGTAITNAFGSNQQAQTQAIARYVGDFAIGIVNAGIVLGTFASVANAVFSGVKVVVLAVLETFVVLATGIVGIVNELVHGAATIPGFTLALGGVEASTTAATLALDEMAHGLTEQIGEAAKGVAGNNELGKKITETTGTFMLMRDAMIAAQSAQLGVTATAPHPALKQAGEAAALTAAQMEALEKAADKSAEAAQRSAQAIGDAYGVAQDRLSTQNLTGTDLRIEQNRQAMEKEILGYQNIPGIKQEQIDVLTEMSQLFWDGETLKAQGHYANVELAAEAAGFRTQGALQTTASNAALLYGQMLESGRFSYGELTKAGQASADAERLASSGTALTHIEQLRETARIAQEAYTAIQFSAESSAKAIAIAEGRAAAATQAVWDAETKARLMMISQVLDAASTAVRAIFARNKSTAIAVAIIDTASAVLKALASAPPPWNFVLAALSAAAGIAQINTIRNQDAGFALGTPGTSFQDFGAESTIRVHGREAIVNEAQGRTLADMLAGARDDTAARTEAAIERLGERLEAQQRRSEAALPIMIRDSMQMAMA